jgi:hypothetical protein
LERDVIVPILCNYKYLALLGNAYNCYVIGEVVNSKFYNQFKIVLLNKLKKEMVGDDVDSSASKVEHLVEQVVYAFFDAFIAVTVSDSVKNINTILSEGEDSSLNKLSFRLKQLAIKVDSGKLD